MSVQDFPEIYDKQDLWVDFECYEDDGSTVVDLSSPGSVEFKIWRTGLRPFEITTSSEDPGAVEWSNRATGKGTLKVPLQDVILPPGISRIQLRAIDVTGGSTIQELGFVKIISTR